MNVGEVNREEAKIQMKDEEQSPKKVKTRNVDAEVCKRRKPQAASGWPRTGGYLGDTLSH